MRGLWRGLLVWSVAAAAVLHADGRAPLKACAVLTARLAAGDVAAGRLDTARIQDALNVCNPGRAVVLRASGARAAFLSQPLILPRGVTLYIDRGVTLFASRNPRDYDLAPSSCGAPPAGKPEACKPFVFAYQAAFSGLDGSGTIDGQGQAWWGRRRDGDAVPALVSSYESQGFHLDGVLLRNAAGIHAAIYKTTAFTSDGIRIESPATSRAGAGLLLSNAAGPSVSGAWIRVPADAVVLKASILGKTTGARMRDLHLFGGGIAIGDDTYGTVRDVTVEGLSIDGARTAFRFNLKGTVGGDLRDLRISRACLHGVAGRVAVEGAAALPADRNIDLGAPSGCVPQPFSAAPSTAPPVDLTAVARYGRERSLVVAADGSARFRSVQEAIDALPLTGGDVTVGPGTYRELVTIRKPHVRLHGAGDDPARVTIVYNNGPSYGGTFASGTVYVEAADVTIDHLTIANDLGVGKGQGVALAVTADRAAFRNLRILGAQDTLLASARYCYGDYGPCLPARQYFADSYIEGNVDFIFGDSLALFERCELHGIPQGSVMFTAHSRHTAEQHDSAYVFDRCRLTGDARAGGAVSLGRPWRPYATVIFLNTAIDAPVVPAGWTEWPRFGIPSLPTAYYAEYASTGPGAAPAKRDPHSHQLTAAEAERSSGARLLAGADGWQPRGTRY